MLLITFVSLRIMAYLLGLMFRSCGTHTDTPAYYCASNKYASVKMSSMKSNMEELNYIKAVKADNYDSYSNK